MVQWTPYTKYTNWVQGDPSTIDNNISRILYEVANGVQWISTSSYPMSFEEFTKSTDTPYNLAMAFINNYERPADPNQPERGEQANYWYKFLTGVTPPTPTPSRERKFKWVLYAKKLRDRRIL